MNGKTISSAFRQDLNKSYSPMSRDEEIEAVYMAKMGNVNARNKIVNSQLRMMHKMALIYADTRCPVTDLMAEGVFGIDDAIANFDPTQGSRFYTLASFHVRNRMNLFVHSNYTVRVPMDKAKVGDKTDCFSMNVPLDDKGTSTFEDTLMDDRYDTEAFSKNDHAQKIVNRSKLNEEQTRLLRMHFSNDMTMEDIGEALGISKQAVSVKMRKTLDKMKQVSLAI